MLPKRALRISSSLSDSLIAKVSCTVFRRHLGVKPRFVPAYGEFYTAFGSRAQGVWLVARTASIA